MESTKKLIIILVLFMYNCSEKSTFSIDNSAVESILKTESCVKVLSQGYGLDKSDLNAGYLESLLFKFIQFNSNLKYQRLVFLKVSQKGEVPNSFIVSLRDIDGKTEISSYFVENQSLKKNELLLNSEIEDVLSMFNWNRAKLSNSNVLLVDFKSNKVCDCKFRNDLSPRMYREVRDLSFFNR